MGSIADKFGWPTLWWILGVIGFINSLLSIAYHLHDVMNIKRYTPLLKTTLDE